MYLENINETHVFSSFGTTFINSEAKDVAKTITFTEGYNLDSNLSFKVLFEKGHITSTNTAMTLNNKNIKVYIRGTLSNLPTHAMTVNNATVYTSLQEGTILELFYNGSSFVIVGNPIIYSNDDYEIYANGDFIYKKKSYTNLITANGENNVLLGNTSYSNNNYGDVNVSNKCSLTFNPSTGTLSANTFSGTATTACNACKGWNGSGFANFGSNAFNSTAFTTCTGTVTSVNVSVNGVSGTAVTSSGTITLNNVNACNSECFGGCTYACAKSDFRNYTPSASYHLCSEYYAGYFICPTCICCYNRCYIELSGYYEITAGGCYVKDVIVDTSVGLFNCCDNRMQVCVKCISQCQSCLTMQYYFNIENQFLNKSLILLTCASCPIPQLDFKRIFPQTTTGLIATGICYTAPYGTADWSTYVNTIPLIGFC